MKKMVLGLVFAAVHGGVAMGQSCITAPERQALDVVVLKTSLMVAALSCGASDKYNSFMAAFQPYLLVEQQVMDGFFARAGGLAGRTQEDGFLTMLANDQSQAGLAQGAAYCGEHAKIFGAVLALQTPDDLAKFVAVDRLANPLVTVPCGPGMPVPARVPAAPLTVVTASPLKPGVAKAPRREAVASNEHPVKRAATPAVKKPAKVAAPVLVQI